MTYLKLKGSCSLASQKHCWWRAYDSSYFSSFQTHPFPFSLPPPRCLSFCDFSPCTCAHFLLPFFFFGCSILLCGEHSPHIQSWLSTPHLLKKLTGVPSVKLFPTFCLLCPSSVLSLKPGDSREAAYSFGSKEELRGGCCGVPGWGQVSVLVQGAPWRLLAVTTSQEAGLPMCSPRVELHRRPLMNTCLPTSFVVHMHKSTPMAMTGNRSGRQSRLLKCSHTKIFFLPDICFIVKFFSPLFSRLSSGRTI